MSAIGGVTFNAMTGAVNGPGGIPRRLERMAGEDYQRWAVDGQGTQGSGIRTLRFVSLGGAVAHIAAEDALMGEAVTITDDNGLSYANCKVLRVRRLVTNKVLHWVDGWMIRIVSVWDVEQNDPTGGA